MRLILTILIGAGLVIIALILIFKAFASLGTYGNTDNAKPTHTDLVAQADNSSTMTLTTQGPVESNLQHDQIVISVSNSQVEMQIIRGYEGHVTRTKTFDNNQTAYADFLRALDLAGFTQGNTDKALADSRGYCATGERYTLQAKGDDLSTNFWAASCTGKMGNSEAQVSNVVGLFQAQIPDYDTLTSDVDL